MKCPACNIELNMTDRQGIEIDYCPQCRGVWLDRGELDKLIDRSASIPSQKNYERHSHEHREYREHREYDDEDYYKRKKRKSFLSDVFDFD